MTELPKTFEPGPIEARWYDHWERTGQFRPERPDAEPFTIVMPPPNVTGSLHIGHALDNTLQDILVRHARMQGKDSLWVVGTDHAGIATQMVVERQLNERQQKRTDFSRDDFVAKVWEWKEESGGQITRQLRRLGASCDWSNERFTMDPGFSQAVLKVFVELHKRGRIYRDKRLVNWDPRFGTAISDLEVETKEVPGKFWTLRYPLADGSGHIEVATTRPETMLADMAVAVHPEDSRYTALVGKQIRLPITGRLIPIVADEHADPELGSGAVKVTPGHDFNDFEVGKRAGLKAGEMLNMLDAAANVCQTQDGLVPEELLGRERFDARRRVVELLDAEGALVKVEDRTIATPFGDRSGVVIEPWLTDQWYVDVKPLADRAMAATRSGEIKIVPESWSKTWYNWLENIQSWCVSRQLWWGHRIPAWYDADGNAFVAMTAEEAQAQAGDDRALTQDPDVLDTWFSSALWPFATLGWPEQTHDLARHYPNDVLISGFDILFFWDARMAMQGLEFMDEVPWKTLYLHGLVRDAAGQKMSKSKGNTVDPLGLIDKYGADALRFTMAAMESQGRDIKLDEKRVEGYRNFATKLWNAARFLQMNGVGASASIEAPSATFPVNRWIIGEVVETLAKLDRAFAELRFDGMADAIYHFTWGSFCDWYVELIKGSFDEETRAVAAWVFDQILVMLHPFMPFVTEELWHGMGERPYDLIVAKWPEPNAQVDPAAKAEIDGLVDVVAGVRALRAELNVPWTASLVPHVIGGSAEALDRLAKGEAILARMVKVAPPVAADAPPPGSAQILAAGATIAFPLGDAIDLDAEKARLAKAIEAAAKERDSLAARLANPAFAERAKPEAVAKARADHETRSAEAERLSAALARLG
ncbi:valine--tRNA ligase [Sphingomonas astaxanthinifaciens]|uniref:Valine--tRNA ligase n=1 Tax=Sphingomonas astaxanthinifaciens DSM 22298 TaxID=1123267 RepID=A0ABQ5Z6L3_9SPHN|nr:valine--tRNA ligase [Sphingomonas astaxanthinifaciens]GLR47661.1 valine--tRNA ligase [Sphingomonas astaxanthinifaciens DSM 22298]